MSETCKKTYMYITHAHTTNQPSQKAPAAYEVVDSADWDPLNTFVFANYSRINPYLCIEKMKYNIVLTILHKKWHSHLKKYFFIYYQYDTIEGDFAKKTL